MWKRVDNVRVVTWRDQLNDSVLTESIGRLVDGGDCYVLLQNLQFHKGETESDKILIPKSWVVRIEKPYTIGVVETRT